LPGFRPNGRIQLPNQWSLRPAGSHLALGDFPVSIAVHPSGNWLAILHAGYGAHEVFIIDVSATARVVGRTAIDAGFYGVCFAPDGARLYCSGATKERVESFAFSAGTLSDHRALAVGLPTQVCVPAGLAVSGDGTTLYAAGNRGHLLVATVTGGELMPIRVPLPADSFPYACVLDEAHQKLYVSLWGQASVAVVDLPIARASRASAIWPTEDHPNEMLLSRDAATLYVANANRNTVSVIETATGRTGEVISSALYPGAPNGSTPNSIALAPDEKTLYIANADNNNLAVIDVSQPGQSRAKGFIPVGWYPTSVRVSPDGKRLFVTNGKGITPKANRAGPNPVHRQKTVEEYIAGLFNGTLMVLDVPDDAGLRALTAAAYECSPLRADRQPMMQRPASNPIPGRVGDPSPIQYCLYVIKENRTYDQVLGDMAAGNGDPSLCIFGAQVTPNQHALARDFVLLDNFYVEAEVSADGHEWSMAAYATDFVEKSWPLNYGNKSHSRIPYPSEGKFKIAAPSAGYIWDRCAQAGVSYRSFGEFVERNKAGELFATVDTLKDHFDPQYEPFNLGYSDLKRAERFIAELHRFEAEGDMPRFQVVRLPNNHTEGTRVGKPTPTAMVAENDLALGRIVEAITHSSFWPRTAIFVVEDDAQNGSDHVDAHRTTAFVISPYARRGVIDRALYSTTSMLRTMELILGLEPMSQFDAAARPMYASFQAKPDLRPYRCRPAGVDLDAKNGATAWGADLSEQLDLSKEDAADDLLFNDIIWRSVRGPDSPMPPPVRAGFVFGRAAHDDDDDD
jgi:YVTN family beta-propeller protein